MKAKIPSNMFFTDLAACCVTLGIKYSHSTLLFLRFYLFIFRERGKEEKKGRETSMGCLSQAPNGDLACNPGMCPDWESNWQFFGL